MEIILTEDVLGLGDIGEKVKVKAGYARNYLIPRGSAIEAGSRMAGVAAHKMKQIEAKSKKLKGDAESFAKKLSLSNLTFELRVGKSGKVFGSVTAKEIADKLNELGHDVDRRRVLLAEPIKKVGAQDITVRLHKEVEGVVRVTVVAIEALPQEDTTDIYDNSEYNNRADYNAPQAEEQE